MPSGQHRNDRHLEANLLHTKCLICISSETPNFTLQRTLNRLRSSEFTVLVGGLDALITTALMSEIDCSTLLIEFPAGAFDDENLSKLDELANYVPDITKVFAFGEGVTPQFAEKLYSFGFEQCFFGDPDESVFQELGIKNHDTCVEPLIIAIVGLTGGVGASLIALNLAHAIHHLTGKSAAILNGKGFEHSYSFLFGGELPKSISAFGRYKILQLQDNIHLFDYDDSAAQNPSDNVDRHSFKRLIALNDPSSDVLMIDCDATSPLLNFCHQIVLIAEPDFKNLNALRFVLQKFALRFSDAKIHVALNKLEILNRTEFNVADFNYIEGQNPFSLYKFSPAEFSETLASSYPVLPNRLLKDQNAIKNMLSAFGIDGVERNAVRSEVTIIRRIIGILSRIWRP